jgi:hypothetical protein
MASSNPNPNASDACIALYEQERQAMIKENKADYVQMRRAQVALGDQRLTDPEVRKQAKDIFVGANTKFPTDRSSLNTSTSILQAHIAAEVVFRSKRVALGSGMFVNYGMVRETFLEVWNTDQEACLSTSTIVSHAPHEYKTAAYDADTDARRVKPMLDEEFRAHDPPTLALAEDLWVLTQSGTVYRILAGTPLRGVPPSR